jgi:hypothetical protein
MADGATVTANGDVAVVSLDGAVDSRSRAPDVTTTSPVVKRGDGDHRFRADIEGMRRSTVADRYTIRNLESVGGKCFLAMMSYRVKHRAVG